MIVKDEEAFLAGCLESVAQHVDEMVVVDTGSSDRTIEIARTFGARVVEREWPGGFAEARNWSIDEATGDFILVLDADERLADGAGKALRATVDAEAEGAPATLYLPLIVNVDAGGHSLGADHMPRLWRNRPDLRFEGRIHESVAGPERIVRNYVDAITILHLGYDPSVRAARNKSERNITLLEAELAGRPGNPELLYYLAKEKYALGDDEGALALFRKVIADGTILNFTLNSHLFGAECLRTLERPQEAQQLALAALRKHRDYGELWYVAAKAAVDLKRWILAEAQFKEAKNEAQGLVATAFRDPSVRAWRADLGRGRALLNQGRLPEALELLEAVRGSIPEGPDRVDVDMLLVEGYFDGGDHKKAWVALQPIMDTSPADATPAFIAFANLYLETMGPAAAYQFVEDALHVHPNMTSDVRAVGAAAELAELIGDQDRRMFWLKGCVKLGSNVVQHYLDLASLLAEAGELSAAEAAARAAQRLLGHGGDEGPL